MRLTTTTTTAIAIVLGIVRFTTVEERSHVDECAKLVGPQANDATFTPPSRVRAHVHVAIEANDDPAVAESIEKSVGWVRGRREVARRFEAYPGGHFVAQDASGATVGAVSVVVHAAPSAPPMGPGFLPREPIAGEPFAWVGGMVVLPHARGRGVGRALLERALAHAEAEGARVVGLDATAEGRPLYEKLGFVALGTTPRYERPAGSPPPQAPPAPSFGVHPISVSELLEVGAFDAPRFGASRTRWLGALLADHPGFLARDRATGEVTAYAFAQERAIAPVVADSPEAAQAVILACERAGAPTRVYPWDANPRAEAALAALGYARTPHACTRMARGGRLPMRAASVYGIGAWALG